MNNYQKYKSHIIYSILFLALIQLKSYNMKNFFKQFVHKETFLRKFGKNFNNQKLLILFQTFIILKFYPLSLLCQNFLAGKILSCYEAYLYTLP